MAETASVVERGQVHCLLHKVSCFVHMFLTLRWLSLLDSPLPLTNIFSSKQLVTTRLRPF